MTTTLADMLFSQGFGTRRVCAGLVAQGHVTFGGVLQTDPAAPIDPTGARFTVQGTEWPFVQRAYLLLHKPSGYECSHKPGRHPSVYTLLPAPLRQRGGGAAAGVQAVGRLDQDTTGLLILSDDGQFIHKLTSPRHHVPKVYEVTTVSDVTEEQVNRLCAGVRLDDSPKPVCAAAAMRVAERHLQLTLTEGKYHQVKRMLAAVGNPVEALHRSRIGSLELEDLPCGKWRWLTDDEVSTLSQTRK